ncbi:lipopolysaccharide assembly protein LapB [Dysgonomonas sp. 25]|uniref:tetratricopeptide repeat protein n=1 Tax=Dysgonomonas sp. 25 TaxID=2302933 RepID=UPI0013D3D2B3|nr:hypothetical protein [Dysgonomonas sp. 25]NDV67521.1 hypothetical protein [Dysgonomonas sp. 25]
MNQSGHHALFKKQYSAAERLYSEYTENPGKYSGTKARELLMRIEDHYSKAKMSAEELNDRYNVLLMDMKRAQIYALKGDTQMARSLFNHVIRDAGRMDAEALHLVLESHLFQIYTFDSEMDRKAIRQKCNIALQIGAEYLDRSINKYHRIIYAHAEIEKYLGLMEEEEDHRKKMYAHYLRAYELYNKLMSKMPEMYTMGFASIVERLTNYYVHKVRNYPQAVILYEHLERLGETYIYRFKEDENKIIHCLSIAGDGFYLLGETYSRLNKAKKSAKLFESAARVYAHLARYSPQYRKKAVEMQRTMGYAYLEADKTKQAYEAFEQAAEVYKEIDIEEAVSPDYEKTADLHLQLGKYYITKNSFHKAIRSFETICESGKTAMDKYPDEIKPKTVYATGLHHMGCVYGLIKKHKEQKRYLERALAIRQSLLRSAPENIDFRFSWAETVQELANLYMHQKHYNRALRHYNAILEDRKRFTEEDLIANGGALLELYTNIGALHTKKMLLASNKSQKVIDYYTLAYQLVRKLYDKIPRIYQKPLAEINAKLGEHYYKMKEYIKAREHLASSSQLYRKFDRAVDRPTWNEMMSLLSLQVQFECKVSKDLDIASEILDYMNNSYEKTPESWKEEIKDLRYKIDVLTSDIEKLRINI